MSRIFSRVTRVVAFAAALLLCLSFGAVALGEKEEEYEEGWILCQPDSYVNIRTGPSKRTRIAGQLYPGDKVLLDGKKKWGYWHCVGLSNESGDGWVSKGFIVDSEPLPVNHEYQITANGRVAARRSVDGTRRVWMRDGNRIFVYMASDEWCLTNKGFVKTDYINFSVAFDLPSPSPAGLIFEDE